MTQGRCKVWKLGVEIGLTDPQKTGKAWMPPSHLLATVLNCIIWIQVDFYHLGIHTVLIFALFFLTFYSNRSCLTVWPAALTIIELNQEIDKRGVVSNGSETVQCSKAYDICYFSIALSHCVTEILKLWDILYHCICPFNIT